MASYDKVFVAGGSKGVGREIIDKLVNRGKTVVAIVKREDAFEELNSIEGVTALMVDAFDLKGVEGAIDGCDACISTLGKNQFNEEEEGPLKRVDYVGNRNVIESAGILGVTRIILVTSVGCGDSKGAISEEVYQTLEAALVSKTKAEDMLQKYYTNSDWTIVRPGGLKTAPMTGAAVFTEDKSVPGMIHREDVAELVVEALEKKSTFKKVLTALDPTIQFGEPKPFEAFKL
eukprot:CAMPEP_0171453954 /NCGR_PEP_ID=MMETSP0945-20130129/1441_1 /TAXON_ID=109269 /ORGANISM="Vaucheria litorea, Strain CCMP2940" /LENGTH=231 /DNA_ID=CAMNT_0011978895 /DNA_START=144 /DNA_END=839 /DNA_ORIENTATION=-